MGDNPKKHDVPRACPGPWRLVYAIMPGLYLYRCEACGDERMVFGVPKTGRKIDVQA